MANPPPSSSSFPHSTHSSHSTNGIDKSRAPVVAVPLLQPRVAVALGVPKRWHHTLSACRLLSIAPPICWGLRFALRFLVADLLRLSTQDRHGRDISPYTLRLTETGLAIIWVCHLLCIASWVPTRANPEPNSVAPRPTSPSSSPTASCHDGSSTIPRKPPSCVSSPLAVPLLT